MSINNQNSEVLIDNFIDELWLEKGLSKNTLSAYRHDISSFSVWYKGSSLLEVQRVDLLDYLAKSKRCTFKYKPNKINRTNGNLINVDYSKVSEQECNRPQKSNSIKLLTPACCNCNMKSPWHIP